MHVALDTSIAKQSQDFMATGDFVYDGFAQDIGSLLDDGVKVALLHGDRDFRCHCKGFPGYILSFFHINMVQGLAAKL